MSDVRVTSVADADAEIELAARWARAQLERGATSVGIVVPDLAARARLIERMFQDVLTPGSRTLFSEESGASVVLAAPQPLARIRWSMLR